VAPATGAKHRRVHRRDIENGRDRLYRIQRSIAGISPHRANNQQTRPLWVGPGRGQPALSSRTQTERCNLRRYESRRIAALASQHWVAESATGSGACQTRMIFSPR
jgi:hypothetical protein